MHARGKIWVKFEMVFFAVLEQKIKDGLSDSFSARVRDPRIQPAHTTV